MIFLSHLWQSIRNQPQNRISRSVVLSNIHERVSNSKTTRYRDRVDACLEAFYKSVYNTEMGGMPTNVLFTATGTVFNLFSLGRPRRGRSLSSERPSSTIKARQTQPYERPSDRETRLNDALVFKEFSTC